MKFDYENLGFSDGTRLFPIRYPDNKSYMDGYRLGKNARNKEKELIKEDEFMVHNKKYQRLSLDL